MNAFVRADSGAVTVDWVVLTAGLVGLGLAVMGVVSAGVQDTSTDISQQLGNDMIQTSFADAPGFLGYTSCDQAGYDANTAALEPLSIPNESSWDSNISGAITNYYMPINGYFTSNGWSAETEAEIMCQRSDSLVSMAELADSRGLLTQASRDAVVAALGDLPDGVEYGL